MLVHARLDIDGCKAGALEKRHQLVAVPLAHRELVLLAAAVETLLREGLGRVGEAEVAEPRMPNTVAEVEALSWSEMTFIFAISYAQAIRAFVD